MQPHHTIDLHRLLKLVLTGDVGLLIAAIQFLELQIRIQRERLAGPVHVTPAERRKLLAAKQTLGEHAADFLLIVTDRTFKGWSLKHAPKQVRSRKGPSGRLLTPAAIERLIVRMATENRLNRWSKTRIHGELTRMGLGKRVSRTTVGTIM